MTTLPESYTDELRAEGLVAGLDVVGFASAEPFTDARRDLEQRKAEGLNAGMQFTYRNPGRSTDPQRTLPGAASLVVGARSYARTVPEAPGTGPHGRVARVATGQNYAALRAGLDAIAERLLRDGWQARVLVDDNALVDRAAARRAGLGWFGKNANILVPGRGSWFVLGSVLTDARLEGLGDPASDRCGTCTRCVDACPTGAIVAPGVVDARRCLAWLVQAEGDFPVEYRAALGDRLYGCDDCQEVCPPNRVELIRHGEQAPDGVTTDHNGSWVDLIDLLDADDATLLVRHGSWYIARRDPRYLRRNALVALGNVGDSADDKTIALLERYALGDDEMLASHATWALQRLSAREGPESPQVRP